MENRSKSKTNYSTLILISLTFVLFLTGAYYLGKQSAGFHGGPLACSEVTKICSDGSVVKADSLSCEFPSCPESNINSPTPNPNLNWSTYKNTKYSFQFNYPSDWTSATETEISSNSGPLYQQISFGNKFELSVKDETNNSPITLDEIKLQNSVRDISASNFKAYQTKDTIYLSSSLNSIKVVIIEYNNQNINTINQILSTFKFTK